MKDVAVERASACMISRGPRQPLDRVHTLLEVTKVSRAAARALYRRRGFSAALMSATNLVDSEPYAVGGELLSSIGMETSAGNSFPAIAPGSLTDRNPVPGQKSWHQERLKQLGSSLAQW